MDLRIASSFLCVSGCEQGSDKRGFALGGPSKFMMEPNPKLAPPSGHGNHSLADRLGVKAMVEGHFRQEES